jgi:hypothetical protein
MVRCSLMFVIPAKAGIHLDRNDGKAPVIAAKA